MRYKHFTKDQRNELSVLLNKGYSIRDIAYTIRKNPSSVSREIKKNSVKGQYEPGKADHKAYKRRKYAKYQGMKIMTNFWLRDYIEEKMKLDWSPEQIAGRLKVENNNQSVIGSKSIYKYLYTVYGQHLCKYLKYRRIRKKKKNQAKSIKEIIKNRIFIDQRPKIINQRLRCGDFEGDTLGFPKRTKETIAALIERKSRYILAKKIEQLKYAIEGFKSLFNLLPVSVLSLTLDNGPENARYPELNVDTYFCNPYSAWEKGSVENALGLIREYIPKKKNLAGYSQEQIDAIVDIINNTPRKCLGFRTPKEVFKEEYLSKSTNFLTLKCCTSGYNAPFFLHPYYTPIKKSCQVLAGFFNKFR